ncbi:aldehyde dehydrogenase family protein [Sphaerisporangium album]|uniref:Aldehyde dehydrogenase family protein n=1 Tax=Sphaerisporangium album TaxID=509200 RepID=A0A367ESK9_9ACTN|nr:aldehyde dehydrogenase family protein [Sphaerisporangium album]RCG20170.1 aldehyde dehydrogenase family protein [Sphaerisporangium album]
MSPANGQAETTATGRAGWGRSDRGPVMLERARWAARAFARYDKASVDRVVAAVARVAADNAERYAEWAVRETGFGVAEHKTVKNLACSTGLADAYAAHDYVSPRADADEKLLSIPRPAGVVFALTPSTNPVATVYFKILLALMTRNAIVISPHPMARQCCADAARTLADAAVAAGAPDGVVQVVEEPTLPLVEAMMADPRVGVIVATGGTPVVRAAYRSGNPALGVGPGNVPVLVDRTADLESAARLIVESKSFDNSILCTNESVLIAEDAVADRLVSLMRGAHPLSGEERDRVRAALFPGGAFDTRFVGKDAAWIAREAGVRVPAGTKVLLAPFDLAVPEEPLAHEKLCPVLGFTRVDSARRGIDAARAVLRITGAGHSAAIHSTDPATIMEYGASVPVLRVSVNAGNSTGSSGIHTNLPISMTIGTGFVGGSSAGHNLRPDDLVNWTRVAYHVDAPFGDFDRLDPWSAPAGPVPRYPEASNARTPAAPPAVPRDDRSGAPPAELRDEIRRLILEELASLVRS